MFKKKHFTPKPEEVYYYLDNRGSVYKTRFYAGNNSYHSWRFIIGNCFQTFEEANKVRSKLIKRGRLV